MIRHCPSCNYLLSLYDRYFCSKCGIILPDNLIQVDDLDKKTITVAEEEKTFSTKNNQILIGTKIHNILSGYKRVIGKKLLFISIGLIISSFLGYFVFNYVVPLVEREVSRNISLSSREGTNELNTGVPEGTDSQEIKKDSKYIIKSSISSPVMNFNENDYSKYLPYETDLIIKGSDLSIFKEQLLSKVKNFSDNFISGISDTSYSGEYTFFLIQSGGVIYPGLVFNATRDNFSVNGLESTWVEEETLVLTTNKDIIKTIEDNKKGLSKSLALNPIFTSAINQIPYEGKIQILALSKNGKGFIYNLLNEDIGSDMSYVFNSYLDTGLDYAVIN